VFWRAVQGMSAGAGIVVSRAVIRDMFPPADAQRVMSQVTIYFGIAPAVAPMVGGFLFVHAAGTRSSGSSPAWACCCGWPTGSCCPRRCMPAQAALQVGHLMRGYWRLGSNPRFFMLALASGIPFNGMFLYVLSAPVFLGELLHLGRAVLLVLHAHHRRHHGRRLAVRAAGRAHRPSTRSAMAS
jgi:DHA1 family bicyclomycin/chloramphenicol resistance-like MFS transporter